MAERSANVSTISRTVAVTSVQEKNCGPTGANSQRRLRGRNASAGARTVCRYSRRQFERAETVSGVSDRTG
jgi:hypothetical protein